MNLKVFCLVFILAINLNEIISQDEFLSCEYYTDSIGGYICELFINNPKGLNNFLTIRGTHLTGYSDNNVQIIRSAPGSNTINIPSIICQRFKNTIIFELSSLQIQRIDDYSFNDCTFLDYLPLYNNEIHTISEKAFSRNSALTFLNLQNNQISTLPENVFLNQYNVQSLFLYSNKIYDLPRNIFKSMQKLRDLNLLRNQIRNLRVEWFENLHNLKYLDLNNNYITDLQKNIFSQLKSIETISLSYNNINTIHADSFGFLPTLQRVNFGTNQVNAIDENLIDYTGINKIDLLVNVCTNRFINDNSISRDYMRAELSLCFYNYENQMSVCRQNSNLILQTSLNKTATETFTYQNVQIRNLKRENGILRAINKKLIKEKAGSTSIKS